MKKTIAIVGMICALAMTVNAADAGKKPKLTDEQKALKKEMLEKYDANKDGKLDKEEKAKISAEDKAKMEKAGLLGKKGKKPEGESKKTESAPSTGSK